MSDSDESVTLLQREIRLALANAVAAALALLAKSSNEMFSFVAPQKTGRRFGLCERGRANAALLYYSINMLDREEKVAEVKCLLDLVSGFGWAPFDSGDELIAHLLTCTRK